MAACEFLRKRICGPKSSKVASIWSSIKTRWIKSWLKCNFTLFDKNKSHNCKNGVSRTINCTVTAKMETYSDLVLYLPLFSKILLKWNQLLLALSLLVIIYPKTICLHISLEARPHFTVISGTLTSMFTVIYILFGEVLTNVPITIIFESRFIRKIKSPMHPVSLHMYRNHSGNSGNG